MFLFLLAIFALCLPLLAEEPPKRRRPAVVYDDGSQARPVNNAEELPKKPPHVTAENDQSRPNSTSTTPQPQGVQMDKMALSELRAMPAGGGDPTVAALKADLAYANARIEALTKQLAFEMQACWQVETMPARFEAATAARAAEKLKPTEPKKKRD